MIQEVAATNRSNGTSRTDGKMLLFLAKIAAVSGLLSSCALPPGVSLGGEGDVDENVNVLYSSIDPSLVSPSNDEIVAESGNASNLRPKFGITAGVVYDDNLYLDSNNPISDVEFTITPRLTLGLGDVSQMDESYVALDYQPTAHIFLDNSDENAIDQNLLLHGLYRLGKLRTKATGRYLSLSGANREIGGRIEQDIIDAVVESAWEVTGKTAVGLRVGIRHDMYEAAQYADTTDRFIEGFAEYAITGKTTIGVGGRFGQILTDNADDQDYIQAFIQAQTRPAEKLTFTARAGVDRREFDGDMKVHPLLEASLNYKPREGTEIQIAPFATLNPSTLNPGESYVRTGATASVRQKIGSRFYAKVEAGYENGEYSSSEAGAAERNDDYWYIKPSIGYQLKDNLSAEIYFRHSENASSNAEFDYVANQIGASLNFQY